jgi:hypothetical protein
MAECTASLAPRRKALSARSLAAVSVLSLVAGTNRAEAQDDPDIAQTVHVYEMARAAYDPAGIMQGSFLILADASESAAYDDNIFASNKRIAEDFVNTTNEILSAGSQWLKHSLSGRIFATQQVYANHSTENVYTFGGEGTGRLDITNDVYVQGELAAAQLAQSRATPEMDANAVGRPFYNTYTGTASAYTKRNKWFDRFGVSVHKNAYISSSDASRSGTQYIYFNRTGRDLSPFLNVYVEGAYAMHEWVRRPEFRNFDLLTAVIGGRFQIPEVLDLIVSVGALRQDFHYAAFDTLVTPTFNAQLLWNIMPLTSVILTGDRTVLGTETFCGGTPAACAAGAVRPDQRNTREATTAVAGIQHEFRHNLLGEIRFRYERDTFDFNGLIDNTFTLNLNARFLINRHWEAQLEYAHNVRIANLPENRTFNTGPYDENVVSLTLKAGL